MAFSVGDFQDLVRLLEQRPEWRAELRRLVLTDELLGLPAAVRALAEGLGRLDERGARLEAALAALAAAQARTDERVARLAERVAGLDERVAGLDERVAGLDERVARLERQFGTLDERVARLEAALVALAEAQARTEASIAQLTRRMGTSESHIGALRGDNLERRYRERAAVYFRRVVRRPTPLSAQQLVDLMDSQEAVGRLSEDERDDVLLADLVVSGRPESGGGDVYLVVEVSATVDSHDVERAARRAALLGRLRTTLAWVAGESITPNAEVLASQRGVWRLLDGRAQPPTVRAG